MSAKYNFFEIEKNIRTYWEEYFIYQVKIDSKKPFFVIDTPPPTVSGNLHIGHIFSYTQQDMIARFQRMQGIQVIYPFGFDDNGLPTERYIEKEKNISSHQFTRAAFTDICLQEIQKAHQIYINLFKKMGFSVDCQFCYSTISKEVQAVSQKSFIELYKKGFIYKKYEPALYCTTYQTSVSQADLEEKEKETILNTIIFYEKETEEKILIATTRPELLSGCVAVLVHPQDTRFSHLIGKIAIVPIYNQEVPIIADEMVIPEKGTGVVMTATFGDALDVAWFKKYNFQYKQVINTDGKLTPIAEFLQGMKVEEAREVILEKLKEEQLIVKQEKLLHRVSIYERSKKEIEYIMLSQWFVSLLPFKKDFIEMSEKINWYPEYMKYRYKDWVDHLSWDWCISRQRFFGIPFPIWYDKKGTVIVADIDQLPIDPSIQLPAGYTEDDCTPDLDVMDTWNTSSLTPYIIQDLLKKKGIEIELPLSIRPQAHDIIRTWAFDTIVKSFLHEQKTPWKDIVISGHVLSSDSQKISKSKGNSPLDPEHLVTLYPADVIRYWTASAKLGVDTAFSENQFKDGNRLLIKLWNAAICLKNVAVFAIDDEVFFLTKIYHESVNSWIISVLKQTITFYKENFLIYEYNIALKEAEKFFWLYCDFYLEIIKMYSMYPEKFSEESLLETKKVAGYVFLEILKLFAPFLPHITEKLFQEYYIAGHNEKISLHHTVLDRKSVV